MVVTAYAPMESGGAERLLAEVRGWFPSSEIIVKTRAQAADADAFAVERFLPPRQGSVIACEQGLKFEVGTDPAHDFGIYLDAAKARAHVRGLSHGRNVLNLFSYAGAFGIAAAAGGATSVTNVDPNKDYLAWSLRNARLNDLNLRVLPDTAQDFLRKHLRRMQRQPDTATHFDLVIVDPPAFGVGRGNQRLLRLLWPEIFDSLRVMEPAHILLTCNDKYFRSRKSFVDLVQAELGDHYRFWRLGTCLTTDDVSAPNAVNLRWTAAVEDPHYVEPVVLAGTLT